MILDSQDLACVIEEIDSQLAIKKKKIETLEDISRVDEELRKHQDFGIYETWASWWMARPIACFLPEKEQEEWIGTLYKGNRRLIRLGYPRSFVTLINIGFNIGQMLKLIRGNLQFRFGNFFSIGKTKDE